jgi:toxin ParE1/3/4
MAKYDITKEAREDLFRIWEYTVDTWSEDQADNYFTTIISALERIASAPEKNGWITSAISTSRVHFGES